jgi:Fic family protein
METSRTGRYIKQLSGEMQYNAFIPENLPFDIKYDDKLVNLLSKADSAIARLDEIAENLPDINYFLKMYIGKEASLSSQIEGTQATLSDYLMEESKLNIKELPNDTDEIRNYINAMNYGINRLKDFPFSLPLIKEIHKILLKGVRGEHKTPGEFRMSQNWIGGSSIQTASYIPPPVEEMKTAMHELEKFFYASEQLPVLIKTALIHYQFETIHPFLDGNGRIGRLLITFFLIHKKVLKKPLLYLSEHFKKYRQEYYDALSNARDKDNIEGWLKFFLEGVKITSDRATITINKVVAMKKNDLEKINASGLRIGKLLKVYENLYSRPFLTSKIVKEIIPVSSKYALEIMDKLEKLGIIEELEKGLRPKIYIFEKYRKVFEEIN